MSNITKTISTDDIVQLSTILLTIDKYMIIILYIAGIIGSVLNMITFSEKRIRLNSCSIYFLATSIVDFSIMNVFILTEVIISFDESLSVTIYETEGWCKFGNYIMFILPCLSSTYITLASVDRYCISSLNQTVRKWSRVKVSRLVVIILFLVWTLFGLHVPIAYNRVFDQSIGTTKCTVETSSATAFLVMDGFLFALFNGAIVPFLLWIFGSMIYCNIRRSHRRVVPREHQTNRNIPIPARSVISRQNAHMITMLLVQVSLTIIFNTPYIVIYLMISYQKISLDPSSLFYFIVFAFIARWFYCMNYCKTFYINTLTSSLFRRSLRKQLAHAIRYGKTHIIARITFNC